MQSVRNIVVAGEKVSKGLVETIRSLHPDIEIVNEYGPTENSVITSALPIKGTPELITIGRPIANTRVYILGNIKSYSQRELREKSIFRAGVWHEGTYMMKN
ncbi:AMP-binding protein [Brevibacillus laterosporus]